MLRNGIKYMLLCNNNDLKKKSLNDNVYFTVRDIFKNGDYNMVITANYYNGLLTNNISYEDRNPAVQFQYANVLEQPVYLTKLLKWLSQIGMYSFDFVELEGEDIDMAEYIKWEDWWQQFEELKRKLECIRLILLS